MSDLHSLESHLALLHGQIQKLSARKFQLQNEIGGLIAKRNNIERECQVFMEEQSRLALNIVASRRQAAEAELENTVAQLDSVLKKAQAIEAKEAELAAAEFEIQAKRETLKQMEFEIADDGRQLSQLTAALQSLTSVVENEYRGVSSDRQQAEALIAEAQRETEKFKTHLTEGDRKLGFMIELLFDEIKINRLQKQLLDEKERMLDNKEKEIRDQFDELIKAKKYIDERKQG